MRIANVVLLVLLSQPVFDISPLIENSFGGKTKRANRKTEVDVNFSLLNKQGMSSRTFTEGEDFTFLLTLVNNSRDTLYLDNSFLEANGFCSIYTEDNKLIGQPFSYSGAQIVSSDAHPFFGAEKEYVLKIPWNDSRSFWSTLHHNFKGSNQGKLPKGKYYTVFNHRFCFDRNSDQPSLCLQPVNIRIDFEVI